MLIAKNKKETIDNIKINLIEIQSNPIKLQKFLSKYEILSKERSNQGWNLQVNMKIINEKDGL